MRTVHKYPIPDEAGPFTLRIRKGFSILYLDLQRGAPQLWCEVDDDQDFIDVRTLFGIFTQNFRTHHEEREKDFLKSEI